jgi:tetratricopeptide (TPR) repeat protein
MSLLDRSFHIVTSPSSNGVASGMDLPSLKEWRERTDMKKQGSESQQIDMYLEDVEDVGPRMFRKAIVVSDTMDMALLQLVICYNKAIIYHATQDLQTASNFYELILSRVNHRFSSAGGFPLPQEWLHLSMCVYNNLGQICYERRVECMAISHFETALKLGRSILASDSVNVCLDYADVLSNWCRSKYMDADVCINVYAALEEVLSIRMAILSWDHVDVASAHFNLGVAEYLRKNNSKAMSHLLYYLKIASHHASNGIESDLDPLVGLVYLLLIKHDDQDDKLSRDLVWGLRSLQEKRSEVGPRHHEVAAVLNYIGTLLFHAKELEHALLFLQEELQVEEHFAEASDRFGVSVTCNNIGRILQELGRYPQAIHYYRNALSHAFDLDQDEENVNITCCKTLNDNPAAMNLYSTVWYNLGLIHDKMGVCKKAIKAFQMALHLRRNMLGPDHADIACLVYNIGVLQMEQQMLTDATTSFQEALRIRNVSSTGQLNDRHVVTTLQKLASLQKARGNIPDALAACQEVIQILKESNEFDGFAQTKFMGAAYRDIAELHHALGNLNVALDSACQSVEALRTAESTSPADFSSMVEESATSLLLVGSLQHELCEPTKAQECFGEAVNIIQDNSNKVSAALSPLLEVSMLLQSNQCAAEA